MIVWTPLLLTSGFVTGVWLNDHMQRNRYKFHGPETWALIRAAYLGGETALSIARRFDVNVGTLRMRATKDGWTRSAHAAATDPAAAPNPAGRRRAGSGPSPPGRVVKRSAAPAADVTPAELLRRALREVSQALDEGRTADARALSQMAESLSRTAAREPKTPLEVILRAVRDTAFRTELFRIDADADDDPDLPVKRAYWNLPGAKLPW